MTPFGPLFATPDSKLSSASGFLFRIGRLSICAFSTVLVTSALVVFTSSAPASTVTDSCVAPTSRVIGGTEYWVAASNLMLFTTSALKPTFVADRR